MFRKCPSEKLEKSPKKRLSGKGSVATPREKRTSKKNAAVPDKWRSATEIKSLDRKELDRDVRLLGGRRSNTGNKLPDREAPDEKTEVENGRRREKYVKVLGTHYFDKHSMKIPHSKVATEWHEDAIL